MEDISASCLSLNFMPNTAIEKDIEISKYEEKGAKTLWRQIFATSLAASFHIVFGIGLAYSAILNPELLSPNSTDFKITKNEAAWCASIITLAIPVGAPIGGILMDTFGRLNTVKMATIPAAIGWIIIATSSNLTMLIAGRILTGLASALGTGPAIVYATEIARADIRGSLISFAPAYTSLGMVLAYIKGWATGWRITAWMCTGYALAPLILIMFIPESPAWLISKGKHLQALKSLEWLHKHQPQPYDRRETFAELQFRHLKNEHMKKLQSQSADGNKTLQKFKEFLKPTGYKPLLVLFGMFLCQQFSGIYITLFYSVEFFQEVGSDINPYLSSILIGAVRAIMSVVNTYMLKTFRRRPLVFVSAAGMALCMFVSGLFTMWIKDGTTHLSWIPVIAVLLYVVSSMFGLLSIPWTMTAELFPIQIRGVAHSVVYAIAYLTMFFSIQSYRSLVDTFGGVAGVQWFFAIISLVGLIFAFIFLPETHGLELAEIQQYFANNSCYIRQKSPEKPKETSQYKKTHGDIIRKGSAKPAQISNDQNQNLLESV